MGKCETVALGELGTFQTGGTPTRSKPDYFRGTLPWITTTALGQKYIGADKASAFISPSALKESATKLIPEHSILIGARVGVGKVSINTIPICINQDIVAISNLDSKRVLPEYLQRYLETQKEHLNTQKRGATIQGIRIEVLKEMMVPVPSLPIQQKIANALDKASALIEMRKAQIEKLDLLIKSQFIEMFGDPVTNPKGWKTSKLSELSSTRLGKMLDGKKQTGSMKFPYLANFNVQWFNINLNILNEMDFDEADQIEFALKRGDLLVCEGGEVGRCAIWREQLEICYFQKALHRVRCNTSKILPEYLQWWFHFRSEYNRFEDIVGHATISHLTGIKLNKLGIMVPPISFQVKFADIVQSAEFQKEKYIRNLSKLENNYKSLMQKCFSGEMF